MYQKIFTSFGILILIITLSGCSLQTQNETLTVVDQENQNLKKNEKDQFISYYPNYFEETNNEETFLKYTNPNNKENNIETKIFIMQDDSLDPTDEKCKSLILKYAESINANVKEAKAKTESTIYECDYTFEITSDGVDKIAEMRYLAKPIEKTNVNLFYSINAVYTKNSDSKEITDLQDSLKKFSLK